MAKLVMYPAVTRQVVMDKLTNYPLIDKYKTGVQQTDSFLQMGWRIGYHFG